MVPVLFVLMILAFIVADVLIRAISQRMREAKSRKERLAALDIGLNLDFTSEAKSLKRVDVSEPQARILAVDDESVILDSFRKILVVAGYAIDTVESGREALGLVQKNKYDFVFTDLKMPEMDGLDVVKGVKHFSPETDVIVITGYATIESAVNAMKYGALDYVQKPFTEDELVEFTKKCLIRRQDRIGKQIKPLLHVATAEKPREHEFILPGGVFISEGHVWANLTVTGLVRVGIDDFVRKMIGRIDSIEYPARGTEIKGGERLFSIRQGARSASFLAPLSGTIHSVNADLSGNLDWLAQHPYERGWVCSLKPTSLARELEDLRIGDKAACWYQEEIRRIRELLTRDTVSPEAAAEMGQLVEGQLEDMDERIWLDFCRSFLNAPSQPQSRSADASGGPGPI